MRSVVINTSHGKFCLSHKAFVQLRELGQPEALQEPDQAAYWPLAASPHEPALNQCGVLIPRDDAKLVQVVKNLGVEANGHAAQLKIVDIPQEVIWEIGKHDGVEHVSERHRTWR